MKVKIIWAKDKEFKSKDDENTIVRGVDVCFLDPETGNSFRHFLGNDNLKGFNAKLVSKVLGPDVELSRDVKTFQGKDKVVVDSIAEVK